MNRALYNSALVAVRDCMGLMPGEKSLIVTDEPLRTIGYAFWQVVRDLGNEVLLVEMLPRKTNGQESYGVVRRTPYHDGRSFCSGLINFIS